MIMLLLTLSLKGVSAQCIVAHRGFHSADDAVQNSIAALDAAQRAKIDASECDVNISRDGKLIVAHGPEHRSGDSVVRIDQTTFDALRAMPLANGETPPTFDEYLVQASKSSDTKLIVELKSQQNSELESTMTRLVLDELAQRTMQHEVIYISFSRHICSMIAQELPTATVLYLNGDLTPDEAHALAYSGINYHISVLRNNTSWIARAHELGMRVGVWTVNGRDDAVWCIENDIDYITSDDPMMIRDVIQASQQTTN